ncbi:Probable complex I intermediate-associated protein 30 [Linum perenne]
MSRFRSLWQASLNATKKALKGNLEELMPPSERVIFSFNSKEELKKWHLYSDSEYGGVFSGSLSVDLDEDSKWNISRGGFCGMRSKKFDGFIDLDSYDSIAIKLKGDGRSYISTIPLTRYLPTWRGNVINAEMEMNPLRVLGMSLSVNVEGGVPGARTGPGDFRVDLDWIKAVRSDE